MFEFAQNWWPGWRLAAAGAIAALLLAIAPGIGHAQDVSNEVVASVDGEPITKRDVEVFAAGAGVSLGTDDFNDSPEARRALKALIDNELLNQELKKYEDKVDESEVDRYIDQLRISQHMTEAQMRDSLQQQGISFEDFRKHARDNLVKTQMIDSEVRQKIQVSDADIQTFYDQHKDEYTIRKERLRLAQILIVVPANATPQQTAFAQRKAEAIRAQALKGMDFNDLARKYSDDESKTRGGELGWFEPGDVMDQILAAVKNLKPGDISAVIRTNHGFHIVKLEDHEVPGPRPLADVKEEIRGRIQDSRMEGQLQHWTETELIKKHYVESLPNLYTQ
jgi:peptidyl-prolyl cis-trans isomerase SurA